jgi:hypothetical protein
MIAGARHFWSRGNEGNRKDDYSDRSRKCHDRAAFVPYDLILFFSLATPFRETFDSFYSIFAISYLVSLSCVSFSISLP